ncbi:MAG: riboflavin synthase [Nitrospinota bacterium]|nr:riboflavin synthase [Nitrospinota bacterium]
MFTGIVEGTGIVRSITRHGQDFTIQVDPGQQVANPKIGESVAVDGVCLTVVEALGGLLTFHVSVETVNRTNFQELAPGQEVNLERALAAGDRLGGHIMQGHVDCVGRLLRMDRSGQGYEMEVQLPAEGMRYVVEKGSIAISGISLTVAARMERSITSALIPHTFAVTNLKTKSTGSTVNIEYDIIAKYVENLVKPYGVPPGGAITEDMLRRTGFIK